MKILGLLLVAFSVVFASVDINSADVKELSPLKGIGVKKAEAIVDEIVKVKGIGKKFLAKNKENLKAGACKKK